MKTLINMLIRVLGVMVMLFGVAYFLPILTGTNLVEGVTSIMILVICVYIGGIMTFSNKRLKLPKRK